MNWPKILVSGLAGGVAMNLADFVNHGVIMGSAYSKYPVFGVEPVNPLYFTLVAVCIALAAALLFERTRERWAPGWIGGLTFGFFAGFVVFFQPFYNALVVKDFPYHLSWCWGGINLIGMLVAGLVMGAINRGRSA
jgi:hypothetical protein